MNQPTVPCLCAHGLLARHSCPNNSTKGLVLNPSMVSSDLVEKVCSKCQNVKCSHGSRNVQCVRWYSPLFLADIVGSSYPSDGYCWLPLANVGMVLIKMLFLHCQITILHQPTWTSTFISTLTNIKQHPRSPAETLQPKSIGGTPYHMEPSFQVSGEVTTDISRLYHHYTTLHHVSLWKSPSICVESACFIYQMVGIFFSGISEYPHRSAHRSLHSPQRIVHGSSSPCPEAPTKFLSCSVKTNWFACSLADGWRLF